MRDYLLFIDTETTGLPKKWSEPYSKTKNWPHIVQIAWIIYHKDGREIKKENHYIYPSDFKISAQAKKIHGITTEFLTIQGKDRNMVMDLLSKDLEKYQPMLVAHFMELDLHLVNADFYRCGIKSVIKDLPVFCTMLASSKYVQNYGVNNLRLNELYVLLFNKKALNIHNALGDAEATAESFFELIKRGDINEELIEKQQVLILQKHYHDDMLIKWSYCIFVLILLIAILFLLWKTF